MMKRFFMGLSLALLLAAGLGTLLLLNMVAVPRLTSWTSRSAVRDACGGPHRSETSTSSAPGDAAAGEPEALMVFDDALDAGDAEGGSEAAADAEMDGGASANEPSEEAAEETASPTDAAPGSGAAPSCATAETDPRLDDDLSKRFEDLLFGPSRTLLWKGEKKTLQRLARVLEGHDRSRVLLCGHAVEGERGGDAMRLSVERAQAAADFLEKQGIGAGRIQVGGMGERQPADTPRKEDRIMRSRRVQIFLFEKGDEQ